MWRQSMYSLLFALRCLLSLPASYSEPMQESYRALEFQPSMLDFQEQAVGVPEIRKVYLHNPSSEETIILLSISAATSHFYTSFFQNRIILPKGNTSFDVVFQARVVGNVENTFFINTSHHGIFTYQVFGVGAPDPYRLRPFTGCRAAHPLSSDFLPLVNNPNPCREALQVGHLHARSEDFYLDLPNGQKEDTTSWEMPSVEKKMVMKTSITSRIKDNHTGLLRIKARSPTQEQYIILPVKMAISTAPDVYISKEMLDFGALRSQDPSKHMNVYLVNLGTKDVPIKSVNPMPSIKALTVDFEPVTVKPGENIKIATISFHASKVHKGSQFSGKITIKTNEESYTYLDIPYKAEVFNGYLWFDSTATLFHIRDSLTEPVKRPILVTNTYDFPVLIHNVSLAKEAKTMFNVQNVSQPILIPPHESHYLLNLHFWPVKTSTYIDSNIVLITNVSKFYLPVRAFTGFLEVLVLPPSLEQHWMDFGVVNLNTTASILLAVFNSNPTELEIKSWKVTGDGFSIELLRSEPGNKTTALSKTKILQNASASYQETVILSSGYYALFRVTLLAQELKGTYDEAIRITSDYEILTIPVKADTAVEALTSSPKQIILPKCFPGKVVRQSFGIVSSLSQSVKRLHIHRVTDDERFYHRRLKTSKMDLESRQRLKIANIYFDGSLECGNQCYVGLPFLLKLESASHGLQMQQDLWSSDTDLHQTLLERWRSVKENNGDKVKAIFEMTTALQSNIQTEVTAQMVWPSIINSSREIIFPLTQTHSSSVKELVLQNPADRSLYIQILPLTLYPNSSDMLDNLIDRATWIKFPHISNNTLEFHVQSNQTSLNKTAKQFEECPAQPFVCNALLLPGEVRSFNVKFTPVSHHTVASLLIIRNNLTVVDHVLVHGRGASENLKVSGKSPGIQSYLKFTITESLLKHCTERVKPKQSFTLRKTFKVENTGELTFSIKSTEIDNHICEAHGFKVVDCQEFTLKPKASKDILILFTPDFSASRSAAELRLVTAGGSEFLFTLNASLPYHMLVACSEDLARPSWELELYIGISVIMSFMFLLVMAMAYLEAKGIWEPFKRQLCCEGCDAPSETERALIIRETAQNRTHTNLNEDANHDSTQGMNNPGTSSVWINGPPCTTRSETQGTSKTYSNLAGLRSRIINKAKVSFSRSSRPSQPAQQQQQQLVSSSLDMQTSTAAALPKDQPAQTPKTLPETRAEAEGKTPESSTNPDFSSFAGAVDKNVGCQNASPTKLLQNQQALLSPNKGSGTKRKMQTKPQVQDHPKEKEPKSKDVMKTRPFTLEKEKVEGTAASPPKSDKRKPDTKDPITDVNSNSLELPYITAHEIKRRKQLAKTLKPPPPAKGPQIKNTETVSGEQTEGCHPHPLGKPADAAAESGNISSSEEESDSSLPPEWDSVPVQPVSSGDDGLYQLSLQTMNADTFIKRSTSTACPPPATSLSLIAHGTDSNVDCTACKTQFKREPGHMNKKLTKSISLPDKCGSLITTVVAADYDKSPGGSSPVMGTSRKGNIPGTVAFPQDKSIWSYGPNSAGLWNPFTPCNSNNLNSSGPSDTFKGSGAFSGMPFTKSQEHQPKWSNFNAVSPSIWEPSSGDPLHPWPITTSSPSFSTESVLGTSRGLWSTTTPYSTSIWSPTFTTPAAEVLPNPSGSSNRGFPSQHQNGRLAQCLGLPANSETGGTYSLWGMWGPTPNRRSSEPWNGTSTAECCYYFTQ
ncbi:transmembrane protein 131-like isoform X2 [Brienomyrus brachyistius]|uniref:transmembrane protein 131-like isoform X2 n=1 Tax=Brienomyrus brachyistius TaxID=42636 RepID=UPI0020B3A4BD|nr:transmembrane protein 131-like isoform X2 [Brienomyrus brachyistius]